MSSRLKQHDILCLEDLVRAIEDCYTTKEETGGFKAEAHSVTHCCDWKGFVTGDSDYEEPEEEDVIVDPLEKVPLFAAIKNMAHYHQFLVSKHADGKVRVQARQHAEYDPSRGPSTDFSQGGPGVEVLLRLPFQRAPNIVRPKPLTPDDLDSLRRVVKTFESTNHPMWNQKPGLKEYWLQVLREQEAICSGSQPFLAAPPNCYRELLPYDAFGK